MSTPTQTSTSFVRGYLTRRGLIGAAAATVPMAFFGFHKTPEIAAQQLTGNSLYDQLGGVFGISTVVDSFIGFVAADERINAFFAPTVQANRIARLRELLIQQIGEASGGPLKYTGRTMKDVHTGMGIRTADFTALVEDLVMALDKAGVSESAKMTLLGALGPMASDIVEVA